MNQKIFGIGLSKSGTTSLGKMLDSLGFYSVQENMGDYEEMTRDELLRRMDDAVTRYEAFHDSPWCRFYQRYAERFPHSQFILTLRPVDKWMNSMSVYGANDIPMMGHAYGARQFKGNEQHFLELYERHTVEAIEHFSGMPGRLLVVDIEANPDIVARSIEAFLGIKPTGLSFPKANVSRRSYVRRLVRGMW